jgi:hypothetical protein
MLAHEDTDFGQQLRHVALTVSASVWTWTQAAGLELADGNVLLALSETDGASATAVSSRSGLPIDAVYPALHRLTDRGYALEEHRHHRLTAEGQRVISQFERFSSNLATKGMS